MLVPKLESLPRALLNQKPVLALSRLSTKAGRKRSGWKPQQDIYEVVFSLKKKIGANGMKIQFKMTSGLGTKRRKIQADFFTKNKKV